MLTLHPGQRLWVQSRGGQEEPAGRLELQGQLRCLGGHVENEGVLVGASKHLKTIIEFHS